ncbi:MAG: hypothetical protein EOO69_01945 [Moraxellaceae bacterium]|nr:MAG: hypothetical protein EOO69_01945 [Moraxellaceae bacterium]
MITQQITAVALKLIAIWLVLQMFLNIPSLVMLLTHLEQYQQKAIPAVIYFWMITCFLIIGLVAAYLIFKTATSVLTSAKTQTTLALGEDSQKVLFQFSGIYFVVRSLAQLPAAFAVIPITPVVDLVNLLGFVGIVIQLLAGLWLVIYPGFWLNLLRGFRKHKPL